MHTNLISNEQLFQTYLTPQMENYFYRKLKKEKESYVKLKIAELLKFLLMSHNSYGDIPFDAEIDEVWHLWILQTVQYRELMDKLPVKKFINHCSKEYIDERNQNKSREQSDMERQVSYLVSYIINFGFFTQETNQFWPVTKILMKTLDLDLDGLNNYLKNLIIS